MVHYFYNKALKNFFKNVLTADKT